jgi:hypothetical protein
MLNKGICKKCNRSCHKRYKEVCEWLSKEGKIPADCPFELEFKISIPDVEVSDRRSDDVMYLMAIDIIKQEDDKLFSVMNSIIRGQ